MKVVETPYKEWEGIRVWLDLTNLMPMAFERKKKGVRTLLHRSRTHTNSLSLSLLLCVDMPVSVYQATRTSTASYYITLCLFRLLLV